MNSIDFYSKLELFPLEEFGSYFSRFKESAFRLEQLPTFNVPQEDEAFAEFKSGAAGPPADFNSDWHDILSAAKAAGKTFTRVRVVDGQVTTYLRFEILWAYKRNVAIGENIRFIPRPEPTQFDTNVPVLSDFWLFDERDCFLMEYDYCGTFLGVRKVPQEFVTKYVALKNEVIGVSIDFESGMGKLGL